MTLGCKGRTLNSVKTVRQTSVCESGLYKSMVNESINWVILNLKQLNLTHYSEGIRSVASAQFEGHCVVCWLIFWNNCPYFSQDNK
jgi:hypothetical protein